MTTVYLSKMTLGPERERLFERLEAIGSLSPDEQADLTSRWRVLDRAESMWAADFERFMAALLHVIAVAGVDHVCIGADWDGGGGIAGLEDINALPKITARLRTAGLSDAEIEKIWSGNVLRVVESARRRAGP